MKPVTLDHVLYLEGPFYMLDIYIHVDSIYPETLKTILLKYINILFAVLLRQSN